MKPFKIVAEKHSDGYAAYPLGLKGVVVGEGDTYEEALTDAKSAIAFHIETFGKGCIQDLLASKERQLIMYILLIIAIPNET